jgi:1-acyl-sn-glycerol-3-phosphate acyltransferase
MSLTYDFARFVVCGVPLRTLWRLRAFGCEHVPRTGPLIVAANHISYFDPPVLGVALPRPLFYMAKSELFEIPLFGPLIRAVNAYPVDRSRGDIGAIKRTVEILRRGDAVAVFPEGTRNLDGSVQARPGVALLSSLAQAPVLPAYLEGTDRVRGFAPIRVFFGKPFLPGGGRKATREDLAKQTDEIMSRIDALRELSRAN